ncbi:MAG: endonuclease/exonuclease/phosphatase family protein [Saprospiraceae bacterium]
MKQTTSFPSQALSYIALGAIGSVIALMVLPVDTAFSRELNVLTPYIMVSFFALGLLSLVLSQDKIMKASFLGVAILAFMLRSSAIAPVEEVELPVVAIDQHIQSHPVAVAQYSTSNLMLDEKPNIQMILDADADLLSIQGLTPDWAALLTKRLANDYPHYYLFEDIGVHGLGIFSKAPLGSVDSFLIGDVVQVTACMSGGDTSPELSLVAVQTTPPVNTSSYQLMRTQLEILADHLKRMDGPLITIGDFNNMPWSNEMNAFQDKSNLQDSRRSQYPTYHEGAPHLFDRPVEHIFYSNDLQCLQYRAQREGSTYIGSGATFQLRSTNSAMVAR